jgi:hypothetical protein
MPRSGSLAKITLVQEEVNPREKGVNASWWGEVQVFPSGPFVRVLIKELDSRQLANELIAHSLCRVIGLPVPDAYIVINDGTLPEAMKGPVAPDDLCGKMGFAAGRLLFASAVCGNSFATTFGIPRRGEIAETLFEAVRQHAIGEIRERLAGLPLLGIASAFDEWAAVIDRHAGNLLVGANGEIWLIDHGHAFTGASWIAADLRQIRFGNCLIEEAIQGSASETLAYRVADGAATLEENLAANDTTLTGIEAAVQGLELIPGTDIAALRIFLSERRSRMYEFLEQSIEEARKRITLG